MHFKISDIVAGIPVLQARDLFRRLRNVDADAISQILDIDMRQAGYLFEDLLSEGYISLGCNDNYIRTDLALNVASATVEPYTRDEAEKAVVRFVDRCNHINSTERRFVVKEAVVFGSMVSRATYFTIIDVGIALGMKKTSEPGGKELALRSDEVLSEIAGTLSELKGEEPILRLHPREIVTMESKVVFGG